MHFKQNNDSVNNELDNFFCEESMLQSNNDFFVPECQTTVNNFRATIFASEVPAYNRKLAM